MTKTWNVYLSGEIHSDWRERISEITSNAGLDIAYSAPVTDHASSDDCGVAILGKEAVSYTHLTLPTTPYV